MAGKTKKSEDRASSLDDIRRILEECLGRADELGESILAIKIDEAIVAARIAATMHRNGISLD